MSHTSRELIRLWYSSVEFKWLVWRLTAETWTEFQCNPYGICDVKVAMAHLRMKYQGTQYSLHFQNHKLVNSTVRIGWVH